MQVEEVVAPFVAETASWKDAECLVEILQVVTSLSYPLDQEEALVLNGLVSLWNERETQ